MTSDKKKIRRERKKNSISTFILNKAINYLWQVVKIVHVVLPCAIVTLTLRPAGHVTSVAFAVMKGALEKLKEKVAPISSRFRAEVLFWTMFRGTPLVNLLLYNLCVTNHITFS